MSWTRSPRRSSQPLAASTLGRSRSDAAIRRRRLFLEQLENRSLLAAIGNGLSAAPDYYSLDEDTTLNVSSPGVLGNDSGTSAVLVASPANGAVSFFSDGSFSYTPIADWYGTDSFTYQALDGELISDEITVTLTINDVPEPPPPAPVAGDDTYTTDEDTPLTIGGAGVLDNDQGQSITAAVTSGPANGSVTMNPDGSFTYTPNADFHGSDSFAYTVTDSASQTDDAQVTITVNAVNDPPVAIDVGFSTYEDQQLMVYSSLGNGLLYGASDPDNDYNLTPQLVSQATNGYVDFSYYGSFIYTPAAEFSGPDTFTYQISDGNGGYSNVATVTIQVDPTNDAPVAVEDYFTLAEDDYTFSGNLLTNDSDIDSPTYSPTLATGVSNGNLIVQMDGSFVYNPYANFYGTDSFTYYVSDGLAQSNTVTVWLTITEVNDAPIGAPDSYSTNEDSNLWMPGSSGVLGNDYDVETVSMYLTATLITGPTNGTVAWIDSYGGFSYTPNPDYFGEDTFTYQASDGQLLSEITTVTITVYPINDTPVAADQSYTLDEDTPLTITDPNLGLLAGASDVDGDTLSVAIYNSPQFGQITSYDPSTGTFTYVPNENYFGNDYFTYLVSDGSASAFATANLTINSVNDLPLAAADFYTTNEDTETSGWLHYNDSDVENGSNLTASLVDPALHGNVSLSAEGNFTYTPNPDFHGEDTFTYRTSDGQADSEITTVTITVQPVNDAPVATDQSYTLDEDTPLIITDPNLGLLAGASDVDGPSLFVSINNGPQFGQITSYDPSTGAFTYIPHENYFGNDYFTFVVSDGSESAIGTAFLTINEAVPTISISGVSVAEGNSGQVSAAFAITLGEVPAQTVTVTYSTNDGTATLSDNDYASTSGSVTFSPGGLTSQTIYIPVNSDILREPDETFSVSLSNIVGATAGVTTATGTILNDDPGIDIQVDSNNDGAVHEDDNAIEEGSPGRVLAINGDGEKSAAAAILVSFSNVSTLTGWKVKLSYNEFVAKIYLDAALTQEFATGTTVNAATIPTLYASPTDPGSTLIEAELLNPDSIVVDSDRVNISTQLVDLDVAGWADESEEALEVNPGITVPVSQSTSGNESINVTEMLQVSLSSLPGIPRPFLDFDSTKLVVVNSVGTLLSPGDTVEWGAVLGVKYFKRSAGSSLSGDIHLVFENPNFSLSDTVHIASASLSIVDSPDYIFSQATYAIPVAFAVQGLGDEPSVSNVNVKFYAGGSVVGSWDAGTRIVSGNGVASTGATTFVNGSTDTYTVFSPSSALAAASFGGSTTSAKFVVSADVTTPAGRTIRLYSSISNPADVVAKAYDKDVPAIDIGSSSAAPTQKTLGFNIHRSGLAGFEQFPGELNQGESSGETTAQHLVDNYFGTATATTATYSAEASLIDGRTFGGNMRADATAFSDQKGGFVYFSYGGRSIPGILGPGEKAMATDKAEGRAYTDIFKGSKVSIDKGAEASTSTAFYLAVAAGALGIGWAVAPATPVIAPLGLSASATFGVASSLTSIMAAFASGEPDVDKSAQAILRPFVEMVMPDGEVRGNGAFQPVTDEQTNVAFSLEEDGFSVYTGAKMARYVLLSAETTVESAVNPFDNVQATASAKLTNVQETFLVKAWL